MGECKRCKCKECKLNHKVFQYITTKHLWVPLDRKEFILFDYSRRGLVRELRVRNEKAFKKLKELQELHKKPPTLWERINNKLIEYYGKITRKV